MQGRGRIDKSAVFAILGIILASILFIIVVLLSFQGRETASREQASEGRVASFFREAVPGFFAASLSDSRERLFENREPEGETAPNPAPPRGEDENTLLSIEGAIGGAALLGNRIYYTYVERGAAWNIVIEGVTPGGATLRETSLPWGETWPIILGFSAIQGGNFLFLILELHEGGQTLFYAEYDAQTGVLRPRDITPLLPEASEQFWVSRVLFDSAGNLVFSATIDGETALYIVGRDGRLRGRVDLDLIEGGQLAKTGCGRIFSQNRGPGDRGGVLTEIYMERGVQGNTFPFLSYGAWAWEIHSAKPNAPFDLYFELEEGGVRSLFGYRLATGERELLFTWEAAGLYPRRGDLMRLLADGRIVLFQWRDDPGEQRTDLLILPPSHLGL